MGHRICRKLEDMESLRNTRAWPSEMVVNFGGRFGREQKYVLLRGAVNAEQNLLAVVCYDPLTSDQGKILLEQIWEFSSICHQFIDAEDLAGVSDYASDSISIFTAA